MNASRYIDTIRRYSRTRDYSTLPLTNKAFHVFSFLCFVMSCHIFEGAFASCRATDSWPTGHTYPSRHSVRSPSFPAEGKRRRWCAGIPWKNMEVLSSLAGGSAWLQSLTPRGCQSHPTCTGVQRSGNSCLMKSLTLNCSFYLSPVILFVTVSIYQVPNQSSFIGQHRDPQVLIAWGIGKQFVESVGELQTCSCSSNYMPHQHEFTRPESTTVLG